MAAPISNLKHDKSRGGERPTPARIASACVVGIAHVAIIGWLAGHISAARRMDIPVEPIVAEILAMPAEGPKTGDIFTPADRPIELELPDVTIVSEPEMAIDAPRIDPGLAVDIAPYTARAELMPGIIATILLLLEIAPDGSVISAEIVRSNAGDAANAAAVQYAQATRWMPGKIGGEPRAMQASLTVILGERG